MDCKMFLLCTLCAIEIANAFVKRDIQSPTSSSILVDLFQRNIDRFRYCMGKTLSAAVREIKEKQILPILNILGDQLNKFSKEIDTFTDPGATSK